MAKREDSVLVAQITDTHVGFDADAGDEEFNYLRFVGTVDHMLGQTVQPDLLLLSGDVADKGTPESYARIKALIERIPCPVHMMAGNHDNRDNMIAAFPDCPVNDGFVQYALEVNGLRILCLDTLEHGRHGGAFCEVRAAWLAAELAAHPDAPTMIVMHHPPVATGIPWMDPRPHEPWLHRFEETIAGHDQIVSIACGHLHRPVSTVFAGRRLTISPAVAPAVTLDLRPMDYHHADERGIVDAEPPNYALHYWHHGMMVTHFQPAGDWMRLAKYTENLVPMMEKLDAEKS